MQTPFDSLNLRFPFLKSFNLRYGDQEIEKIPPFVGILLAAIARERERAFCFVLPRKGNIAALAAVLYSLGRFASEFPKLAENYARRSFQKGQRVKLRPSEKIFVFGGLWESDPSQFRLEIMNREGAAFTWPTSEILRIEPTQRKIPHGQFLDADRLRNSVQLSDLDRLIGTRTFGNASLVETHAFYLGRQAAFQEFLENMRIVTAEFQSAPTLANFFATGSVTDCGAIEHNDRYNPQGQPFVAVDSRIGNIAAACAGAPSRSKVVIVDGAHHISDLGKFDCIFETQNIVIFAEEADEEKLRQLYERGCKFWRLSKADLNLGCVVEPGHFFGPIYEAAGNEASFTVQAVECDNPSLEAASLALEASEQSLEESEGDETRRLLGRIYSVLMHCAGLLEPPNSEQLGTLTQTVSSLSRAAKDRMMWISNAAGKALTKACAELTAAVADPTLGIAKANALKDRFSTLCTSENFRIGVVVRSLGQHAGATAWLKSQLLHCPVLLARNLADQGFFDAIICTSWPNSTNFERLVSQYVAPSIYVVAYPFERRWLNQFRRRMAATTRVPNIDSAGKSDLVGLPSDVAVSWPEPSKTPRSEPQAPAAAAPTFQIWSFEQKITPKGASRPPMEGEEMVPTRLVTFVGDAYAFLTDSCKLPVITDLVSGGVGEGYAIPRRRIDSIHVGDVLVFREGGRRDVIHALADSALGSTAANVRSLAAQWQQALRESKLSETEVMHALARVGCHRSRAVVRYWLEDGSVIGPQNETDIAAIAQAIGNETLIRDADRVWQAIRTLRSVHQSAGMRLLNVLLRELPRRIDELHDSGSHIEIENKIGAWIVQVESIAEKVEPRPRSQINSLLWSPDSLG